MTCCQFEEIIVSENLEVKNGLLGLDQDCYLSTIKFQMSRVILFNDFIILYLFDVLNSIFYLMMLFLPSYLFFVIEDIYRYRPVM
jgi:hypothetical protein